MKKFLYSAIYPLIIIFIMWVVKIYEIASANDLSIYGILPLDKTGLIGIITSPFIHQNFSHLISNTVPFFVSMWLIIYFYRPIAFKVLVFIYLVTGLWVWIVGRHSYHIGASGLVYGYVSFLFFSGIIRKNIKLLVISLLVVFLYGGLVWGVIPKFHPESLNISWESHLMGGLAGLVFAYYFRNNGPQKEKYFADEEIEEDDDESDENELENISS